jgi:hypothetical protein
MPLEISPTILCLTPYFVFVRALRLFFVKGPPLRHRHRLLTCPQDTYILNHQIGAGYMMYIMHQRAQTARLMMKIR